jgi:protein-L-isoaspartate(D-aspartate) O-methyltransferase
VLARAAMADRLAAIGFPAPVVAAMRRLHRHAFVPAHLRRLAYAETGLWLGACALAAPTVVARCVAAAKPGAGRRVLEIGTGCGYQTALLDLLGASVFTVEMAGGFDLTGGALGRGAARRSLGGGLNAWRAAAPFDAILVNDAMTEAPATLVAQLAPDDGRLVMPLGAGAGPLRLTVFRRQGDGGIAIDDHGVLPPPASAGPFPPGPFPLSMAPRPLEGGGREP